MESLQSRQAHQQQNLRGEYEEVELTTTQRQDSLDNDPPLDVYPPHHHNHRNHPHSDCNEQQQQHEEAQQSLRFNINHIHTSQPPSATFSSSTTSTSTTAIWHNFVRMSILVATLPATALACLALATAEWGETLGSIQSGVLYATYTVSAMAGATTWLVKQLGPRNALIIGMTLFLAYVACFVGAWTVSPDYDDNTINGTHALHNNINDVNSTTTSSSSSSATLPTPPPITTTTAHDAINRHASETWALIGAAVGGIGAGILWTAQGTYLAHAAADYARALKHDEEPSLHQLADSNPQSTPSSTAATSLLAGWFAFIFLALETSLDSLSTLLTEVFGMPWKIVFGAYTVLAVLATVAMPTVRDYRGTPSGPDHGANVDGLYVHNDSALTKATAVWYLLRNDVCVLYLWGVNALFAFSGAFLNAFVNGQVVPAVFGTVDVVGLLVALHGATAALASLVLGYAGHYGLKKTRILVLGAVCFVGVAAPFVLQPQLRHWSKAAVVTLYLAQGMGRATFEGTLRAVFADYFAYEIEGAFATIILQNGSSAVLGFVLSAGFPCRRSSSRYCLEYHDGSEHSQLLFCLVILVTSGWAMWGIRKAERSSGARVSRSSRGPIYGAIAGQSGIDVGGGGVVVGGIDEGAEGHRSIDEDGCGSD